MVFKTLPHQRNKSKSKYNLYELMNSLLKFQSDDIKIFQN